MCFVYTYFSILFLNFKLFKVGQLRHMKKICPAQIFSWFLWKEDGQNAWTEVSPQIQLECLHPHRDSGEICHPIWVSSAAIDQRVVIGNELLALLFSTTTSLEEVFICHAAREVDINSPPKDTYQGHSPIILCAVTLNRQFITQKKLRIRLARSTTWPNNMYYITVYTSSVSSPVMTDFNISISLILFCVKNCY